MPEPGFPRVSVRLFVGRVGSEGPSSRGAFWLRGRSEGTQEMTMTPRGQRYRNQLDPTLDVHGP